MWTLVIAHYLVGPASPSAGTAVALSFVQQLQSKGVLEPSRIGAPFVETATITAKTIEVRIEDRYTVRVYLPLRQVTRFEDTGSGRDAAAAVEWDLRGIQFDRRAAMVHAASGAPGSFGRSEGVTGGYPMTGYDEPPDEFVVGHAVLHSGALQIARRPLYRFRHRSGMLVEYDCEPIPVPHPGSRLIGTDTRLADAAVAAFRLRDRLGDTAPWEILGMSNSPQQWEAIYWQPVRLLGSEPLAERYAALARANVAIPTYLIRFGFCRVETGTGNYATVCEVAQDAQTGEVISTGIVWEDDPGYGTYTVNWPTWQYTKVIVGSEELEIVGPCLGAETASAVGGSEVEGLLVFRRTFVRAYYRPGDRTVRIGSRVFQAGLGLVRAMEPLGELATRRLVQESSFH